MPGQEATTETGASLLEEYHHVSVVTYSGIPILSRTYGNPPGKHTGASYDQGFGLDVETETPQTAGTTRDNSIAFSHIGTLSSCYLFAKESECTLSSTETTEGVHIQWKMFDNSFVIILFTSWVNREPSFYEELLSIIHGMLTLMVGIEELQGIDQHIDQTKYRLKSCNAMLDHVFDGRPSLGDITRYTTVVVCPEDIVLMEYLKSYAARCNTPYAWLTINDNVCIATNKWWKLPSSERSLLSILKKSVSQHVSSFDIPVFLPNTSPTVPYRLVGYKMLHKCYAIVLLGPSPSLQELEDQIVSQIWLPAKNVLKKCTKTLWPHGFDTSELPLCNVIQSFILVNTKRSKILNTYTLSLDDKLRLPDPPETPPPLWIVEQSISVDVNARKRILHEWYFQCQSIFENDGTEFIHTPKEAYLLTPHGKLYSTHQDHHYRIFIMFDNQVPTISMARMSHEFLNHLLERFNKSF